MSEPTQRLLDLAVSESGFVFDPWSGSTFTVNQTGLVLLAGLKEGLARGALIDRLRGAFDVPSHRDLERDLDDFLHELRVYDVVAKEFQP